MRKSHFLLYKFPQEEREWLEDFGGESDDPKTIGTEEQVAAFIHAVEFEISLYHPYSLIESARTLPSKEIRNLSSHLDKVIKDLNVLSHSTKQWISNAIMQEESAQLAAREEEYQGQHDFTDWNDADDNSNVDVLNMHSIGVNDLQDAIATILDIKTKSRGRPKRVGELVFVKSIMRKYQGIFKRLPPNSDTSAFAEFVSRSLKAIGSKADVRTLIRTALIDRGEKGF